MIFNVKQSNKILLSPICLTFIVVLLFVLLLYTLILRVAKAQMNH